MTGISEGVELVMGRRELKTRKKHLVVGEEIDLSLVYGHNGHRAEKEDMERLHTLR